MDYYWNNGDTPARTCFKLDPLHNDLTEWVTTVKIQTSEIFDPFVYFASTENADGAITQRFFDGGVTKRHLDSKYHTHIELSHVTQHNLLSHQCTYETFYQCFTKNLNASKECRDHGGLPALFSVSHPGKP